jgi:hypothetical protein
MRSMYSFERRAQQQTYRVSLRRIFSGAIRRGRFGLPSPSRSVFAPHAHACCAQTSLLSGAHAPETGEPGTGCPHGGRVERGRYVFKQVLRTVSLERFYRLRDNLKSGPAHQPSTRRRLWQSSEPMRLPGSRLAERL